MSSCPDVTLITVLYRCQDSIEACIRSVVQAAEAAGFALEVVLVDNAPGDGSGEAALRAAPGAHLVPSPANVGFARACNTAFGVASGRWWLLLNPDATLDEGALGTLASFGESHPRAGAIAPRLTGAGFDRAESAGMQPGLRSAVGHFLFVNRLLPDDRGGPWRGFQLQRRGGLGPRRVDWASGGALLLRPDAIRKARGFDPSFFLYGEDVDLGRRLSDVGWESWLVPAAQARHAIAGSSGGVTDRWFVALHDLYARDASRGSVVAFDLIAALGLGVRSLAARDHLHRRRMAVALRAAVRSAHGAAFALPRPSWARNGREPTREVRDHGPHRQ